MLPKPPLARWAGLLSLSLALLCAPADAQQTSSAALSVSVTNAATGEPLRGAQVILLATGLGGVTNEGGALLLESLAPGTRTVEVRYLGFAPERTTVQLENERAADLAFALEVRPVALAALQVKVHKKGRRLELTGFERRKARGFGTFITREQIEARQPQRMSDVLRSVPGVHLASTGFSDSRASMLRSTPSRRCPIQYYMDGVQVFAFNIDDVRPHDIEGLEIYKGASEIPPDFNRGTALCGVIVIWTRVER
ncbi:MAG TPA: TonB-dependent receptor plug domain-containing protein [Longimicrobiaceae bacterium]|nr:TonB-dependent receptor plug domain-containing protein [Longimicrobiaceae bacterium]